MQNDKFFGFDYKSLRVKHAYLNNRFQVTKAVSYYSDGVFGVPQRSVVGPLLFSINISDLFLIDCYRSDFGNNSDGTTLYNCRDTFLEAISGLETTKGNLFDWFCCNNCKVNLSKCNLFLSPFDLKAINIKNSSIGVTVDSNFTLEKHLNKLRKECNRKVHALAQCAKSISTDKRPTLLKLL